jgi:deazaflavin-dependent oxidoreductase (nitroreductase family)
MPPSEGAARWKSINDPLIEQFRAAGGRLKRRNPVLLLTTTGTRTGRSITVPLNYTRDGDRLVVIASAGGSARHPAWFRNLQANPDVVIEHDGKRVRARAYVVSEPDRTRLYDNQVTSMPFFDGYRKRVKAREIPVVAFELSTARSAAAEPRPRRARERAHSNVRE